MKPLMLAAMIFALVLNSHAREMRAWTWQELYDQADLVVIAKPVTTVETNEKTVLPDILPKVDVAGLSTEFDVNLVMKGAKETKKIVLRHYRLREDVRYAGGAEPRGIRSEANDQLSTVPEARGGWAVCASFRSNGSRVFLHPES